MLSAAQVVVELCNFVQPDAMVLDKLPRFWDILRFASQLEVVDLDGEDELHLPMNEEAFPTWNILETSFA